MITSPSVARLDEITDRVNAAATTDELAGAVLQLIAWLKDESSPRSESDVGQVTLLLQLVRDAHRLLNHETTVGYGWSSDVKDWNRAASPFVNAPQTAR